MCEDKPNQDRDLEFMLKEYEKSFDLFRLHYETSEKIFRMYLVIIGAILSITSLVYQTDLKTLPLMGLNRLVFFVLFLAVAAGSFLFLMEVEHRIKLILYVHSVNKIRKWFVNGGTTIKDYLILPTDTSIPKYFSFARDFFWEIAVFAAINSALTSLFIMNLLNKLTNICLTQNTLSRYVLYGLTGSLIFIIHIYLFYERGKRQRS